MRSRIIGNIIIVVIVFAIAMITSRQRTADAPSLDTPSPALGKVVATAIHQTLSDPYFVPLEKLTSYLDRHPGMSSVSVDMMSKWALDDEIPTCFVWNTDGSKLQLDHGADPQVIDGVLKKLQDGLTKVDPNQLLYLKFLRVNGEKFWLGFIRIPLGSAYPTQMAGAFFSMDRYIESDVPRLINGMINRPRFPLAIFQADSKLLSEPHGSNLSMRILKDNGDVYFQRGRTFEKSNLIYAESQYFPKPIVAMMEGWDLEIFSAAAESTPFTGSALFHWSLYTLAALLLSIVWWVGTKANRILPPLNPTINYPAARPGRGIRLDNSNSKDDDKN